MGDFRMTIEGVGGHGCDRNAKQGQQLTSACGKMDCPDCAFAEFVAKMKRIGTVYKATMHHWPADMTDHVLDAKKERCVRCGASDEKQPNGQPSVRPLSKQCREYPPSQEVIDDYSERQAQYGGLLRASGVRVHNQF